MFCNFSTFSTFQFFILNQFLRLTISFLNLFAVRPKQVLSFVYMGYSKSGAFSEAQNAPSTTAMQCLHHFFAVYKDENFC